MVCSVGPRVVVVSARVNGCSMPMVVDSGSDVTVVREEVFKGELEPTRAMLKSVTGDNLRVRGVARVELTLAGESGRSCVYVVAGLEFGILGVDVMRQRNVQLDWGRLRLAIGKKVVEMEEASREDVVRVQLVRFGGEGIKSSTGIGFGGFLYQIPETSDETRCIRM